MSWRAGANDVVDPRQVDDEHLPVEKQNGGQCLILSGSRYPPFDGQVGQKSGYLGRRHLGGMALIVEQNEPPDPIDVLLLRAQTVMPGANSGSDQL
jgi:hypothetical protein